MMVNSEKYMDGILGVVVVIVVVVAMMVVVVESRKERRKVVKNKNKKKNVPPGSLGWPVVGETLEFLRYGGEGKQEGFTRERMEKYESRVFKTSLLGESMIVLCGPAGNKFLFSNENKNVQVWWPSSVTKLLRSSLVTKSGSQAKSLKRLLSTFLNPDALKNYLSIMDSVAHSHFATHWQGKHNLLVYPTVKQYTFQLACSLFASIQDPLYISKLSSQFDEFLKGVISFPINFPGTRFRSAMRAANEIREQLKHTINNRRLDLQHNRVSPSQSQDLLSHLLLTSDPTGRFLTEMEIIDNILLLLFAGHDTSRSVISSIIKYLAQLPQVYQKVLQEQLEISKGKEAGELLEWEDIQKMKYSWNVASEVLRLSPPVIGSYREALNDFTYAGYTIPKGWKLLWSTGSSHMDPTFFPNPENFDASRFEGAGPTPFSYVPFGGGPRMCLGQEFARLEILVFMHNIVKRFKWELLIPNEKFQYDPMLEPSNGLPIRLLPLQI